MESGNVPMAPPPPLPDCKPPPLVAPQSNGHRSQNGDSSISGGGVSPDRQELMSEIRDGVKLKASRDQILHCSVRME